VSKERGDKFGTWLYYGKPHSTDKNDPQNERGVAHVTIILKLWGPLTIAWHDMFSHAGYTNNVSL